MPRGVKNTEKTTAATSSTRAERGTRPRLTAAQKAQKAVDDAQKKYDVVDTKLRAARKTAAALDDEAKELKALLDWAKSSPFLPKTEDPDAPAVMTDADSLKADDPLADVPSTESDGTVSDTDEEIGNSQPLTSAPDDLPGADQLGDAEEDVASGEVTATDAQPEGDDSDPFAQYSRS